MKLFKWISQKSEDLEEANKYDSKKEESNIFMIGTGTFLVALSGFVLYLDKVFSYFDYSLALTNDYYDFSTLVWTMSQTISPILIILGANFKALRVSYIIPLYCYSLQIIYVFFDLDIVDQAYTPYYAIGTTLALYATIMAVSRFLIYVNSIRNAKIELLETIVESDGILLQKTEVKQNESFI